MNEIILNSNMMDFAADHEPSAGGSQRAGNGAQRVFQGGLQASVYHF